MASSSSNNKREFYVVQFRELPFEGIDDYVCVPRSWVIIHRTQNQKAVVAYPINEDPFDIRDRVKRKGTFDDEWKFYIADVKYETDSYKEAEFWIARRNFNGPLVEEESIITDSESRLKNNMLRNVNQKLLLKSSDNPRKRKPGISTKRQTISETRNQQYAKRLKLDEATQSSSAIVNHANAEPGCSTREISPKPKSNKNIKTPPPLRTTVLNSLRQALSTNHNNRFPNEQQLQGSATESVLFIETTFNSMDNARQENERWIDESQSPYHANTSDSVSDHEVVISDHEVSTDEDPVETTNNAYYTGISPGRSSADRPTTAQRSTSQNNQTHPRVSSEQQLLNNFATFFTQMGTTLRNSVYKNFRKSIFETVNTYRTLLDAVDNINEVGNLISNASSPSNSTPIVPQATESHIETTARANSSNENQRRNDDVDKAPKKRHNNLWRFVLPADYDPHDTRWTLKYRKKFPGLVELRPRSGIYVSYGHLLYCKKVSKDCESLARRLLPAVFNSEALSVCSSMTENAQASYNFGSNVRPRLDEHASTALLDFVVEYGVQCDWKIDLDSILSILHSKIQEIRFKYGVRVKC